MTFSRALKTAIASIVAVAGSFGAVAADAAVVDPSSGNSNLILFVRNTATNTAYARDLSVTLEGIATQSAIVADAYTGANDTSFSFSFSSLAADNNLSTFLSSCGATCTWAVMAGDVPASSANAIGASRYLATSPGTIQSWTITNPTAFAFASNINTMYDDLALTQLASSNSIASGGLYGTTGTSGETAPLFFGVGNFDNAVDLTLGSSAVTYLMTGSGGSAVSRLYSLGAFTLAGNGTLSFVGNTTAPVPLPAAAWLLLSGLAGVLGIGRRRAA